MINISDGGPVRHFQGVAGTSLTLRPDELLAIIRLAWLRILYKYINQTARLVMHVLTNLVLGYAWTDGIVHTLCIFLIDCVERHFVLQDSVFN